MPDTLTITDNRTGKLYQIAITDGSIRATDLRQIKVARTTRVWEPTICVHEHRIVPQPHHLH